MLGHRAIGICDSPSGLCRRVAAALGRPADELWFDYLGLNHLGWLRGVHDARRRPAAGRCWPTTTRSPRFEEGALFGGDWLRTLGMIPNEYLAYFYYASDTVGTIRDPQPDAGRVPARAAGGVLRRQRPAAAGGARGVARLAPRPRRLLHGRGRAGRRRAAEDGRGRQRGLRGRGHGRRSTRSPATPGGADPERGQPQRAAVPGRARGRRGARASSGAPAPCRSPPATRRRTPGR